MDYEQRTTAPKSSRTKKPAQRQAAASRRRSLKPGEALSDALARHGCLWSIEDAALLAETLLRLAEAQLLVPASECDTSSPTEDQQSAGDCS
jgi:hypothetical protein